MEQYLNLLRPDFFIFFLLFVSRDLELGGVPVVSPSTLNFFPISMEFGVYIEVDE